MGFLHILTPPFRKIHTAMVFRPHSGLMNRTPRSTAAPPNPNAATASAAITTPGFSRIFTSLRSALPKMTESPPLGASRILV